MNLKYKEYILVIGHNKPDLDTLVSSILMRDILRHNNVKSDFCILEGEKIEKGNIKNLKYILKEKPLIISDLNKYKYFLVDHNDINQSVKDIKLVVGCIDHHLPVDDLDYYYSNLSCCALVIYNLFKNEYEFSNKQKELIFWAFLSDTNFGKSSRYKKEDEDLIKELGFSTNYEDLFKKYFLETKINKKNFLENGYKRIKVKNMYFDSTYLNTKKSKKSKKYKEFIKKQDKNFIGIFYDYNKNKSYAYIKLQKKFYELEYEFIASRATDILKDVENIMEEL